MVGPNELARILTQEKGKRISEARSGAELTAETILASTKIGDPMDESVELGPLCSVNARDDIAAQVDRVVKVGATRHKSHLMDARSLIPQMCSIQSKGDLVTSKIPTAAMAVIMLGVAQTGVAQARPIKYQHHHFHAAYAGPVYSKAARELWPWNVQARGVAGLAPRFSNPGPEIKGYGCLAHPDYGLYTPHFC